MLAELELEGLSEAEGESEAEGDKDADGDIETEDEADGDLEAELDELGERDALGDCDLEGEAEGEREAEGDIDAELDAEGEREAEDRTTAVTCAPSVDNAQATQPDELSILITVQVCPAAKEKTSDEPEESTLLIFSPLADRKLHLTDAKSVILCPTGTKLSSGNNT